MPDYLICDEQRFGDLCRYDTTAETPQLAQQAAEEMARKYGRVYVLQVVGIVDGRVEPQWSKPIL